MSDAIMIEVRTTNTVEVCYLQVNAEVRYWEDGEIDGEPDEDGSRTPFKVGDSWKPLIELSTGKVVDWPEGLTADIHYKVCDAGVYRLLDKDRAVVRKIDGYVPAILSPGGDGYGDYIIMKIDGSGQIQDWKLTLREFAPADADD